MPDRGAVAHHHVVSLHGDPHTSQRTVGGKLRPELTQRALHARGGQARSQEFAGGAQEDEIVEREAQLTAKSAPRRYEAVARPAANPGNRKVEHARDIAGAVTPHATAPRHRLLLRAHPGALVPSHA